MKQYISPIAGFIILSFVLAFLFLRHDYSYLDITRPLDLGREFNRASLDTSKWLRDLSYKQDEQLNIKFYGPAGSLYNYHILGNDKIKTASPEFSAHWNSLFPFKDNICSPNEHSTLEDSHKAFFIDNNVIKFSTFSDYMRLINGLCGLENDGDIAFIWLQKQNRFKNFDCFNNIGNKKLPPTFGSCLIHFVNQRNLFKHLHKGDLVVVGSRFYFLTELFDAHPDIEIMKETVYSDKDKAKVYRVNVDTPSNLDTFDTKIGFTVQEFFQEFKKENPERYTEFSKHVLGELVGLNEDQVQQISNYSGQCFKIVERDYSKDWPCSVAPKIKKDKNKHKEKSMLESFWKDIKESL